MILLDMEMPENCFECRFRTDTGECALTGFYTSYQALTMPLSESCPIKAEIPKNATNGDVIKAMFPQNNMLVNESLGEKGTVFFESEDNVILYSLDWWNAPWKGDKDA